MAHVKVGCLPDGMCFHFGEPEILGFGRNLMPTRDCTVLDDDGYSVRVVPVYPLRVNCAHPDCPVKMFNQSPDDAYAKDFVPMLDDSSQIFGCDADTVWDGADGTAGDPHYGAYGYAAVRETSMLMSKKQLFRFGLPRQSSPKEDET